MELSGQLHAPRILPPGKEPPHTHWIGGSYFILSSHLTVLNVLYRKFPKQIISKKYLIINNIHIQSDEVVSVTTVVDISAVSSALSFPQMLL
jgi:hypothetical protein